MKIEKKKKLITTLSKMAHKIYSLATQKVLILWCNYDTFSSPSHNLFPKSFRWNSIDFIAYLAASTLQFLEFNAEFHDY